MFNFVFGKSCFVFAEMMASMALDGEVRKSLLDRTEAEKAFRPWWDTLEDTLLNTLIAVGQFH